MLGNLPAQLSPLVGRRRELAQVRQTKLGFANRAQIAAWIAEQAP